MDDPDLVVCQRFELLQNGVLQDDSGAANHLDATGITLVPGRSGTAASFGPTALVSVPQDPTLHGMSALTITGWFRLRSLPGSQARYGLVDRDGNFGAFIVPSQGLRCTVNQVVPPPPAGVVIVVGQWHHFACRFGAGQLTAWLDGASGSAVAATITTTATPPTSVGMNAPSGDVIDGDMDEVRIYRRALDDGEIRALAGLMP